jgi:hypothetical protein
MRPPPLPLSAARTRYCPGWMIVLVLKTYLRGEAVVSVMLMPSRSTGASPWLYSSITSFTPLPPLLRISLMRIVGLELSTVQVREAVGAFSSCQTPASFLPIT